MPNVLEDPRVGTGARAGLGVGMPNHPDRFCPKPAAPGRHHGPKWVRASTVFCVALKPSHVCKILGATCCEFIDYQVRPANGRY